MKYTHIALIILGIIFILLPAFHTGLWFDESYSVGIATHSLKDIWIIGGSDVHPVLYYCVLHILNLIFGNNILIYRIFSVLCTAILGIIGFTHIRKDFGEKIGLLFSFLVFFFPVNIVYSSEIRMYSLAMLLVSLTSIYAYRIYRDKDINENFSIKNWLIFAVCSLLSAYTHYYALMASGLINLFLMISLIIVCIKNKEFNSNMKAFIVSGIIQILLYLPWLLSLLTQMRQVSQDYWIYLKFPDSLIEFFIFQFTGNLIGTNYISSPIALAWSLLLTLYMIILYLKDVIKSKNEKLKIKGNMKPAIIALVIFLGIALISYITSTVWKPILYPRYMLCEMGLLIFFFSYTIQTKGYKYINFIICIISMILSLYININFININYDKSNAKPIDFINEDIQENDIILVGNDLSGFVAIVNFPDNQSYFYNKQNWSNVDLAYMAFSENFSTIYDLSSLEDYSGRIWIIGSNDYSLLEEVNNKYDVDLIKQEKFNVQYKQYQYSISLVEK